MTLLIDTSPALSKSPNTKPWPPQGKWAYEDYRRLPDDGWIYEVIEGNLLMSPAPQTRHQRCSIKLTTRFENFVEKNGAGVVLYAPTDVILRGHANPVQPDIIFISKKRRKIVKKERVEGAPDLIIEILSPWNWNIDRGSKFQIYARAGVREYWIVDPEMRTVELFVLRQDSYELLGKYGVGKIVRSEVLSGFKVKVEEICPQ